MRYLSFLRHGRPSYGYVLGDKIVDLGAKYSQCDLASYIGANFPALPDRRYDPDFSLEEISYLPVIVSPPKILCVATNYRETGDEAADRPDYPLLFTRFPSSVAGHAQSLPKPAFSEKFDYEGELAVIIGKAGHSIEERDALSHVAGYSCFNDGSVRDWQKHSSQFTAGKNFDGTAGFGPWMVSADALPDPTSLAIETRVNGIVKQRNNTRNLIFSIPFLISYVSRFAALVPGDVIVTGTPSGFGATRRPQEFLAVGDVVEVYIENIGTLRNDVR